MSEEIEISKEVNFYVCIEDVVCACGANLDFDLSLDRHGDIVVTVQEHNCSAQD